MNCSNLKALKNSTEYNELVKIFVFNNQRKGHYFDDILL